MSDLVTRLCVYVISVMSSFERNQQPSLRSSIYSITQTINSTHPPPAILSPLSFLRTTPIALLRRMPTAILPTSPRAMNKQTMSSMPKTKTNFGAGGKALPDTYKYVPRLIWLMRGQRGMKRLIRWLSCIYWSSSRYVSSMGTTDDRFRNDLVGFGRE